MSADTPAYALLSYFYLIFDKYPGRPALRQPLSPTQVHFLLPSGSGKEYSEGLLEYTEQMVLLLRVTAWPG